VHVDLIKNEWLAGYQLMVARVSLDDQGKLAVDTADQAWREIVLRPVGEWDPEKDPEAFLRHLPDAIHGSYLFATPAHEDDGCPFRAGAVVPIHSEPLKDRQLA
jgi:hypothetical protein